MASWHEGVQMSGESQSELSNPPPHPKSSTLTSLSQIISNLSTQSPCAHCRPDSHSQIKRLLWRRCVCPSSTRATSSLPQRCTSSNPFQIFITALSTHYTPHGTPETGGKKKIVQSHCHDLCTSHILTRR